MSLRAPLLPLALAACVVRPLDPGESATDATATGTPTSISGASTGPGDPTTGVADTGPDPTATTAATTGSPATTGDTTGGCPFLCPPDVPNSTGCDVWAQDCPMGQKCMPYSGDGDSSWESVKCVDIVRDPAGLYEPCTLGPVSTGEDTCDKGLMCWNWDPDTGVGTCHGMCTGSLDNPGCADPQALCNVPSDGVFALCLPMCDPVLQDCDIDDLCIPDPLDPSRFICVLDASGEDGQTFDPCEYANSCDQGHACLAPELAAECDPMGPGCCIPFCDITLPNTCPGAGQECVSWYEPGPAPPNHAHVGVCAVPMP